MKNEYVIWGIPKAASEEQLLLTQFGRKPIASRSEAKTLAKLLENKFGVTKVRIQTVDLTDNDIALEIRSTIVAKERDELKQENERLKDLTAIRLETIKGCQQLNSELLEILEEIDNAFEEAPDSWLMTKEVADANLKMKLILLKTEYAKQVLKAKGQNN